MWKADTSCNEWKATATNSKRIAVLLLLSTGALIAADNPSDMAKEELIRQDYERLTGTFSLVSGVVNGKPVPEEVRKKTILITDHNKFTVSTGDEAGTSSRGTFVIDPTQTPKRADSLQADGPDKGKTVLGIYEIIDDNHKRACWAPVGQPRPTAFSSEPGSGHILQLWERQESKK
jgi:uncharacterized protein (TIGR03067 family)